MRKAFTLAEVLITLGIIGVVAAMTMPVLIQSYQKHVTVNQLKKAYSEFTQAMQKAEVENGFMNTWDLSAENFNNNILEHNKYFAENYIFPNLKTVKQCIPSSNGCWADNIRNLSGNYLSTNDSLNNKGQVSFISASGYSVYYWVSSSGKSMWYWVDINGPKKGPNKIGRDIFAFAAYMGVEKSACVPAGMTTNSTATRAELKTHCEKQDSNYTSRIDGDYCFALIVHDGWKIAPDYPW